MDIVKILPVCSINNVYRANLVGRNLAHWLRYCQENDFYLLTYCYWFHV